MAYIDVLPVAEVRTYLRIDEDNTAVNDEIERMINTAMMYIERMTNVLVIQRATKQYYIKDGCVRVYDFPINSVVKGLDDEDDDVTLTYKSNYHRKRTALYTEYYDIDSEAELLVLDVGYETATDVPDWVHEVAKEIIESMYYEQETNKRLHEIISPATRAKLETFKRFIV